MEKLLETRAGYTIASVDHEGVKRVGLLAEGSQSLVCDLLAEGDIKEAESLRESRNTTDYFIIDTSVASRQLNVRKVVIFHDQEHGGRCQEALAIGQVDALDHLHILEDLSEHWVRDELHAAQR